MNSRFLEAVVLPGLGVGGDPTRDLELMNVTASDNQSIQATIHNYRYWGRLRPARADFGTRLAHVLIGGGLTLATLVTGGRAGADRLRLLLVVGALVALLVVCGPVSHLHYPCLALFLVMGLVERSWRRTPGRLLPDRATLAVLAVTALCFTLPMVPVWEARREAGLPLFGVLVLWAAAMAGIRSAR